MRDSSGFVCGNLAETARIGQSVEALADGRVVEQGGLTHIRKRLRAGYHPGQNTRERRELKVWFVPHVVPSEGVFEGCAIRGG